MSREPGTPEGHHGTGRGLVGLVAKREIDMRTRTKAFRILTALMVVGVVVLAIIVKVAGGGGPSASTIGLLPGQASMSASLRTAGRAVGHEIRTRVVPDRAAGEKLVRDGKLNALLMETPGGLRAEVDKAADYDPLNSAVTLAAQRSALRSEVIRLGGDPATAERAIASGSAVRVTTLHHQSGRQIQQLVIGLAAGLLIYMTVMTYGQLVAQSVVEEKSSRVVELLLAALRPWQLMAGKVLGTGVVGLMQVTATAAAGLVAAWSLGVLTLPGSAAVTAVVWLLLWYVLGFFLYAFVFAAVGAMLSRQEDVAGAAIPVMMPLIAAWVLGVSLMPGDPDSTPVAVLSMIPVFSPVLMPMRIAVGAAPAWEIGLSLVLTVLLLAAMVRLSGMVYRNSVLRTGARVRLSEALHPA